MGAADLLGVMTLAAVVLCWGLAVVLLRVGVAGSAARRLALLLVVEGFTLLTSGSVAELFRLPQMFHWGDLARVVQNALHTFGDCGMLALYPAFLASALQTPLTRPLAGRWAQIAAFVLAAVLFFAVGFGPRRITAPLLYLALTGLFIFALAAAIQAWRGSQGEARRRAGFFALAFGVRDLCWAIVYGASMLPLLFGRDSRTPLLTGVIFAIYTLGSLLAAPLIAYGILRGLVADIDVRIRWTIKQSTVAAALVAAYFVVSEGANRFLSAELGNIAGLVATAVVIFFMAPLQRFADRVASAAMPHTAESPGYAAYRKLKTYEAAVADLLSDQVITERERALLVRLRDSLGIPPADAEAVERDLKASP